MNRAASMPIRDKATCLGCGCLCDGIEINRSDACRQPLTDCETGQLWFETNQPGPPVAGLLERVQTQIGLARTHVEQAKSLLVLINGSVDVETCRSAVEFAEKHRATLDTLTPPARKHSIRAIQQYGLVSASWGEVRDRADTCGFWFCDPRATHPLIWHRLRLQETPKFGGSSAARRLFSVNSKATETGRNCHASFETDPAAELQLLCELTDRMLADRCNVESSASGTADQILSQIERSKYLALFKSCDAKGNDSQRPSSGIGRAKAEAWCRFVDIANRQRRCVVIELSNDFSRTAEEVLTWQTGFPHSISFKQAYPEYDPDRYSWHEQLGADLIDTVILIGDEPDTVSATYLQTDNLRVIHIANVGNSHWSARVNSTVDSDKSIDLDESNPWIRIPAARCGVDQQGLVFRSDGLPITVGGWQSGDSYLPSASTILNNWLNCDE